MSIIEKAVDKLNKETVPDPQGEVAADHLSQAIESTQESIIAGANAEEVPDSASERSSVYPEENSPHSMI